MTDQLTGTGELRKPPALTDGGATLLNWYRDKRANQPVWTDGNGLFHVFRYDDVQRVLSDPATFCNDFTKFLPELADRARGQLTQVDPPQHRKLRRLVSTAFTPKVVAGLEPRIAEITRELLADIPDGEFDFVEKLTYPLPVTVIAEMLGVPASDQALFRSWADRLLSLQVDDIRDPGLVQIVNDARKDMDAYLLDQVTQRRATPRDDLISHLVAAEIDGERLDDVELVNFSSLLLLAGHITTTTLLGNAMLCFRDNPAAAAEVRADRSLLPGALEEVLRVRAPFTVTGRLTTTEVDIAGTTIPADQMVMVSLLSANHDERQFTDPDAFDLHRDPNKQVAFGHGIHFCLGAPLARLEARVALNLLFDAFTDLTVLDGAEYWTENIFGVKKLPMTGRRG